MAHASSDIGTLKQVLVHHPDDGIEVITPENALEFLYDDIVYLPKMREEHQLFKDVLAFFTGKENVIDTMHLLQETLELGIPGSRDKLMHKIFELEKCSLKNQELLLRMSNKDLAYTLFTGLDSSNQETIMPPLPNYVFTRDIGVMINDHILICNASQRARTRESILTRFIIYYHSLFKACQADNHAKIIDMTKFGEQVTIEGGDVMMLDKDYLLVGVSERSTPEAFLKLKEILFEKNVIKNIVRIIIPKDRSCMHIDTLFTQISNLEFVIYPETLNSESIKVTQFTKDEKQEYSTLKDFFYDYNKDMKFILCGNGNETFAKREQWTDGCNLVAVKSGVAIAYDRNERTAQALRDVGYNVIDAEEFLSNNTNPDNVQKTIIAIPSTELSRARGGPHCMTMPILRGN